MVLVIALLVWLECETYGQYDHESTVLFRGRLVDERFGEPIGGAKVFGMGLERVASDPESGGYWENVFESFGPTGHMVGLGKTDPEGCFEFERQVGWGYTAGAVSARWRDPGLTAARARCFLRIEIPGRDLIVLWPEVASWTESRDGRESRIDATLTYGTIRINLDE